MLPFKITLLQKSARFAESVRGTLNKHMGFPERRATKLHVARTDKESD